MRQMAREMHCMLAGATADYSVYVVYNEFKSVISQRVVVEKLLPIRKLGTHEITVAEVMSEEQRDAAAHAARTSGITINEPDESVFDAEAKKFGTAEVDYIFDQAPEDELFPYCLAHNIAVIARVPFDEGSLTDTLTADSTWPDGDWRNLYFNRDHLNATLARVDRLGPLVPEGMDLPELALRFILEHPAVSTTIPGMRRPAHAERNLAASDGIRLPPRLGEALKAHRWNRAPNTTP